MANDKTNKELAIESKNPTKSGLGLGRVSGMTGRSPYSQRNESKGIIGHFLSTKKADFNDDDARVKPQFVRADQAGPPKMIDLGSYRKGLNYHGTNQKNLDDENQKIQKEEEMMDRELAHAQTAITSAADKRKEEMDK